MKSGSLADVLLGGSISINGMGLVKWVHGSPHSGSCSNAGPCINHPPFWKQPFEPTTIRLAGLLKTLQRGMRFLLGTAF